MDYKDIFNRGFNHFGVVWIPPFVGESEATNNCMVARQRQNGMQVRFDSCTRVDKPGSIVDFVIRKGSSELLIGLWDSEVSLTPEQRRVIDVADRSYLAIDTRLITSSHQVEQVIKFGDLPYNAHGFRGQLQVINWVYHKRFEWHG